MTRHLDQKEVQMIAAALRMLHSAAEYNEILTAEGIETLGTVMQVINEVNSGSYRIEVRENDFITALFIPGALDDD